MESFEGQMRILIIGASGTIGTALTKELFGRHEIIKANRSSGDLIVDIGCPESVRELFAGISGLHAVVCVAGPASYGPLLALTDDDFRLSLERKVMGQVNLLRFGIESVVDNGSFTLTGGTASRRPMEFGGTAISMANAALEGFARAAAIEIPRGIRVNVVAPGWVQETRTALGLDSSVGWPAADVAQVYRRAIEGSMTGQTLDAG